MSLQDTKLGDLAEITSSKRIYESDYVDSGVPFFRSKEIIELSKGKNYSTELFISRGKFKEIEYKFGAPKCGDLLITSVGTLGISYVVKASDEFYFKDGNLIWFRKFRKKNSSTFLRYWIQSGFGKRCILTTAIGTSQPALTIVGLKRLKVPFPQPEEQNKIAAILLAYDDLIESNRQRIALLETMAEEIYREWFVRLRFPGHEHTLVHKGVPEGWERKHGNELFDTVKGRSYSGGDISDFPTGNDNERPFLTLKSLNRGGGYRRDGLKFYRGRYSDNQIVVAGDVIMAVTDMTQNRAIVGQAARVPDLPECERAAISLDLVCLRPKHWSKSFLYAFCRYSGFASHLAQFANGANVLHLKPSVVGAQKIMSPAKNLIDQFDAKTSAIFDFVDTLSEQAGKLAKTRDLLLNRLISGKLRVGDLDIQFPPSMQDVKAA